MKTRRSILLVCLILAFGGYLFRVLSDIKRLENNELVSEETFLTITNSSYFGDVKKTLGNATRHKFTATGTNAVYVMIGTYVDLGDGTGEGVSLSLLFRDNRLIKMLHSVRRDIEEIPYQGTTASRVKYWDVEDMSHVYKSLDAPALTRAQIQAHFDWLRGAGRTGSEPWNILPAFLIVAPFYVPLMAPRIKRDYETNQELRKQFDGCRANLGMTIKDVDALYGTPLRVFSTKDGRPVRIYGDTRYLEIDPQHEFSCVAVLFDAQGRVTNIYSDGFLNEEWITGKTRQDAE